MEKLNAMSVTVSLDRISVEENHTTDDESDEKTTRKVSRKKIKRKRHVGKRSCSITNENDGKDLPQEGGRQETRNSETLQTKVTRERSPKKKAKIDSQADVEGWVMCRMCNKTCKNKHSLANHKCEIHRMELSADESGDDSDTGKFQCPICHQKYKNFEKYQNHCKNIHLEGELKKYSAETKTSHNPGDQYVKVNKEKIGKKPGKEVITDGEEEMETTCSEKNYQCPYCPESYSRLCHVSRHINLRHLEKSHSVGKKGATKLNAGIESEYSESNTKGEESMERFQCPVCSRTYKKRRYCIAHWRDKHKSGEESVQIEELFGPKSAGITKVKDEAKGRVKCPACPRSYKKRYYMLEHWRNQHKNDTESMKGDKLSGKRNAENTNVQVEKTNFEAQSESEDEAEECLNCSACPKSYKKRKHWRNHHKNDTESLKCEKLSGKGNAGNTKVQVEGEYSEAQSEDEALIIDGVEEMETTCSEKNYQCPESFSRLCHVSRHINLKHLKRSNVGGTTLEEFNRQQQTSSQASQKREEAKIKQENIILRKVDEIQCEMCPDKFKTYFDYENHLEKSHSVERKGATKLNAGIESEYSESETEGEESMERFQCPVCSKTYKKRRYCIAHWKDKHKSGEDSVQIEELFGPKSAGITKVLVDRNGKIQVKRQNLEAQSEDEAEERVKCPACSKTYKQRYYMLEHWINHHKNDTESMKYEESYGKRNAENAKVQVEGEYSEAQSESEDEDWKIYLKQKLLELLVERNTNVKVERTNLEAQSESEDEAEECVNCSACPKKQKHWLEHWRNHHKNDAESVNGEELSGKRNAENTKITLQKMKVRRKLRGKCRGKKSSAKGRLEKSISNTKENDGKDLSQEGGRQETRNSETLQTKVTRERSPKKKAKIDPQADVEGRVMCTMCNKTYKNKHSLANHKSEVHRMELSADESGDDSDMGKFQCPIGHQKYKNFEKYQNHCKNTHLEGELKKYSAETKTSHNEGDKYVKVNKEKIEKNPGKEVITDGEEEMETTCSEKKYHCPHCLEYFSRLCHVSRHINLRHLKRSNAGGTTREEFNRQQQTSSQASQKREEAKVKKLDEIQCEMCPNKFKTYFDYENHLEKSHSVGKKGATKLNAGIESEYSESETEGEESMERFQCPVCSKTYKKRRYCIAHWRDKHKSGEESVQIEELFGPKSAGITKVLVDRNGKIQVKRQNLEAQSEDEAEERVKCPACPRSYKKRYYMLEHWRNQHKNDTESLKSEELSGKRNAEDTKVQVERQNLEPQSEEALITDGVEEMETTCSEKKYDCPHCPESFSRLCHVSRHINLRHLKRSNVGGTTREEFNRQQQTSSQASQKREEAKVKKLDEIQCEMCPDKFKTYFDYENHLEKSHSVGKKGAIELNAGIESEYSESKTEGEESMERFQCPVCSRTYKKRRYCIAHWRDKHKSGEESVQIEELFGPKSAGITKVLVDKNGKIQVKRQSLEVQSEDEAEERVKCPACPRSYKKRYYMLEHWRNQHKNDTESLKSEKLSGKRNAENTKVQVESEHLEGQSEHLEAQSEIEDEISVERVQCPACPNSYKKRKYFLRHWRKFHKIDKKIVHSDCVESTDDDGDDIDCSCTSCCNSRILNCRFCQKLYTSFWFLRKHYMNKHKHEMQSKVSTSVTASGDQSENLCMHCDKPSSVNFLANKGIKKRGKPQNNRKREDLVKSPLIVDSNVDFNCICSCGLIFKTEKRVQAHLEKYGDFHPNKSYETLGEDIYLMRTLTCSFCGRSFQTTSGLLRHLKNLHFVRKSAETDDDIVERSKKRTSSPVFEVQSQTPSAISQAVVIMQKSI